MRRPVRAGIVDVFRRGAVGFRFSDVHDSVPRAWNTVNVYLENDLWLSHVF